MASPVFQRWVEKVLGVEGGYTDHPNDRGGPTNFGITQATAEWARSKLPNVLTDWDGDVRSLKREQAALIYKALYWDKLRLDEIANWCEPIASELGDSCVNCGVKRVSEWFQKALNAMNRNERLFPDLVVDGVIGSGSVSVARSFTAPADQTVILRMLDCLQGAHYLELAKQDPRQEDFVRGWFLHRIRNEGK